MRLAKVVGTTVSTAKESSLTGLKLLVCAPCTPEGQEQGDERMVAVDTVGAGVGEIVLVAIGSAARTTEVTRSVATDATVVGIVDSIQTDGKTTYSKAR
jgi:microcompartment protein CcmK/EutM